MSELADNIKSAISAGGPINWPTFREAIHDAHAGTKSTDARAELLQLFTDLMDHVAATQISPSDLAEFNDTRAKDYRLLLI